MEIPGFGEFTKDDSFGWYYSKQISVSMFGGIHCRIVLDGYDEDEKKEEYHVAIVNFLGGTSSVLRAADEPLFRYYKDNEEWWLEGGRAPLLTPSELWQHVHFGNELMVTRRSYGDECIYVSVECECDWEKEHGLQLVFKNGLMINKLGGYDGHLTNSDAFDDENLENVIYP